MLLVAIYAFFYYRLLGTVIFLSLIISGLLTFGALVFLGRTHLYEGHGVASGVHAVRTAASAGCRRTSR